MEDRDQHFGFGEGAVAADETVEVGFSWIVKADWGAGDQRHVAKTTFGVGTHLGAEPTFLDDLLLGANPGDVAVVLGGCGCQFFCGSRLCVKPPEPVSYTHLTLPTKA